MKAKDTKTPTDTSTLTGKDPIDSVPFIEIRHTTQYDGAGPKDFFRRQIAQTQHICSNKATP